ncbi:MAG TPA: hypothetical protein VGA56_16690 [Opitutaceae bacterium]
MAYYRDEAGQMKKRIQNGQRTAAKRKASAAEVAEGRWSATLVEHVRMVASQIEGRRGEPGGGFGAAFETTQPAQASRERRYWRPLR